VRTLCLGLILCAAATAGVAAEKSDKKKSAPKPVEAGRVYTQADLERVIQESKDAPTTPLPPALPTDKPAVVAPEPVKPKVAAKDEPVSFSNDDLERMFGKAEEPAVASEGADSGLPKLPDPLAEIADWQAQKAAADLRRKQAAARVTQLEAQVRDLEAKEVAVRNPLLPRPEPPAGLESTWSTLSGGERVAALQARLADLRQELAEARKDVARAEAEAQATRTPSE
jgi:hypothetical protein